MNPGDVLLWPDFRYKDGGTPSTKLIVILGIDKYKDALLYRATSRDGGYRPDPEGCHADEGVYRFKDNPKPFDVPTWVQFEDPYTKSVAEIQAKKIGVCFSLSAVQLKAIINCLRRSQEFAPWLEDYGI
jgi:hypothetical protein